MPKKTRPAAEVEEDLRPVVTFCGETFRAADRIGALSVMRFAKIAQGGADSSDMDGLAAMYDLLEQCIDPADWPRFERTADQKRAGDEELFDVIGQVMAAQSDRPTVRPSASSDGPSVTAPRSTSTPADRAIAREAGRPDLQLAIVKAQEHMAETA